MKKILLSLSFVAAAIAANAQNFKIYQANDQTSPFNGTPFVFAPAGDPANNSFVVDTAVVGTAADGIIRARGTAPSGAYYINGFGNGSYDALGNAQSIGYTAANFSTDKFFMNVNTNNYDMKVKIQFHALAATSTDVYGYEFTIPARTTFAVESALMSDFTKIVSDNPDGTTHMTSTFAQGITSMEIVVVLTGNSGTGPGEVQFKNMTIGTSNVLATLAASNIGSTKVFPNPTEGAFTTEVNLKSVSNVSVIVTDMTGRQVASKNLGTITSGSEVFNTSDLAKGMYTVTYVLDGAPAKSELVVVR